VSRRFIEFTASIRNRNTRMAYARAVKQFFDRCDERRLQLAEIEAITLATYIEQLGTRATKPTQTAPGCHSPTVRLPKPPEAS
jgi:site-specific recombinase XerD